MPVGLEEASAIMRTAWAAGTAGSWAGLPAAAGGPQGPLWPRRPVTMRPGGSTQILRPRPAASGPGSAPVRHGCWVHSGVSQGRQSCVSVRHHSAAFLQAECRPVDQSASARRVFPTFPTRLPQELSTDPCSRPTGLSVRQSRKYQMD